MSVFKSALHIFKRTKIPAEFEGRCIVHGYHGDACLVQVKMSDLEAKEVCYMTVLKSLIFKFMRQRKYLQIWRIVILLRDTMVLHVGFW